MHIGFNVKSLDAVIKQVAEIGATAITLPADSEWGRRAVVKD